MQQDRLMRFPTLSQVTGLSRSTIWRLEAEGQFPSRRQISRRAVGWSEFEVNRWLQARAGVVK